MDEIACDWALILRTYERDRDALRQYNSTALPCRRISWHVLDSDFAMWMSLFGGEARTSTLSSLSLHYTFFLFFSFPCMWLSLDHPSSHSHKSPSKLCFFFFSLYNTGMQPPKFPPPRLSAVLKNAKPTSFFQAYLHFPYILLSLIPWFLSLSLCT